MFFSANMIPVCNHSMCAMRLDTNGWRVNSNLAKWVKNLCVLGP